MSARNVDLPVLISAEQIRRREFVTARRGYDPDQVRAYLEQLADQVELMHVLMRDARNEADEAMRFGSRPRPDPYDQLGERVAGVIREADRTAETIRNDAQNESEQLTREARADADRIRTDAQAKAEEARARADGAVLAAREQANRTIAGLATRRDALVDQLASMQERLIGVARDLEGAMELNVPLPDVASIGDLDDDPIGRSVSDGAIDRTGKRDDPGSVREDVAAGIEVGSGTDDPVDLGATIVVDDAKEPGDTEPTAFDPGYEDLWEGSDAISFHLPDIPALDLDWGGDEDGDDR